MSRRGNPLDPSQEFLTHQYNDVAVAGQAFEFESPAPVRVEGLATGNVVYLRGLFVNFDSTNNVFTAMTSITNTSLPVAVLGEELINTTGANKDFQRVVLLTGHFIFDKLFLYNSTSKVCVPVNDTSLPLARIVDLIPRNIIVHKLLR